MLVYLSEVENALDRNRLQVLGRGGRWYDIRRNGRTTAYRREPGRVSIPVKLGLRECFRIEWRAEVEGPSETLRVRPVDFDPRTRA